MVQNQIEIVDSIVELIVSSGSSVTNSRRRIIAEIVRKDGLFTAEEIAKDLPNIGRATVYRTIKLFEEAGIIEKPKIKIGLSIMFKKKVNIRTFL